MFTSNENSVAKSFGLPLQALNLKLFQVPLRTKAEPKKQLLLYVLKRPLRILLTNYEIEIFNPNIKLTKYEKINTGAFTDLTNIFC